jgi:hypothetical protein
MFFRSRREQHQLAHASAPEERNGAAEENQDYCEIPMHLENDQNIFAATGQAEAQAV